tara:strand:+ start:977 stop:1495 length:519 start_codon:yes stop_codon:yes gene_type:complete
MAGIIKVNQYQDFNGNTILTSDGNGNLTNQKILVPYFSAGNSANQSISASTLTKITLDTVNYNIGVTFDTTNSRFIVPSGSAGKYWFWGNINLASNDDKRYDGQLYKNGSVVNTTYTREVTGGGAGSVMIPVYGLVDLAVGDYIEFYVTHSSASAQSTNNSFTIFSGYRIGS